MKTNACPSSYIFQVSTSCLSAPRQIPTMLLENKNSQRAFPPLRPITQWSRRPFFPSGLNCSRVREAARSAICRNPPHCSTGICRDLSFRPFWKCSRLGIRYSNAASNRSGLGDLASNRMSKNKKKLAALKAKSNLQPGASPRIATVSRHEGTCVLEATTWSLKHLETVLPVISGDLHDKDDNKMQIEKKIERSMI